MAGHHTCEIQSLTIKFKSGSTELLVGSQRGNDFHQMNLAGHACVMINPLDLHFSIEEGDAIGIH